MLEAWGALPVDLGALPCEALIATPSEALESVPGFAFVLAARAALAAARGNAHSLALDLYDQWEGLETTGLWQDTPPTQAVAALDRALDLHAAEGGVAGRGERYRAGHAALVEGMRGLGFHTVLPDLLQAPVVAAFHGPRDRRYRFEAFYEALRRRGYVIGAGRTATLDSFRIGCIGALSVDDIRGLLAATAGALRELSVRDLNPAAPPASDAASAPAADRAAGPG